MRKYVLEYKEIVVYAVMAVFIGLVVGLLDTLFGKVLLFISDFRDNHIVYLIPFLSLAGLFIVYVYQKIGKDTNKGMSLVFAAGNEELQEIPKRMIPLTIIGTWITHLFGGSAGREGVAVLIGGTFSHAIGRKIPYKNASKIMLITGMAAGFGGLFETPFAATFFALEVLVVGKLEYLALFPALIAALVASSVSHFLGLEKYSVHLDVAVSMNSQTIVKTVVLGVFFGIVGGLFAYLLGHAKQTIGKKIPDLSKRIFFAGIVTSVLLLILHMGRYSGLGTNLIAASFNGESIYSYDWVLKSILTIITLAAGFQGGEVTPIFSIGASLGVWLAPLFGLPIEFVAALGYASVFASATNTLIAPALIGAEVFGFEYLPFFLLAVCAAYVFNGNHSIYGGQKNLF
ncbi:chloride channel protein [Desemzia sp. RIT804]|uniref:chloride channel protein n=1 Tax=Desemzia sp. RIT 804 TaxID=2810209 RepID=UPI00194F01B0|nr:chloride channel protein [Desemzia sp. RIT 804]MBM6616027.1 chloride channel protein [Desemzia sp. RIT 804]